MKKLIKISVLAVLLGFTGLFTTQNAGAVVGSDFNPGYIIDDTVFYNENAYDANGIQTFLNAQMPNCDTNGSRPASEFGRSDITRAQYAAMNGWQNPPFVCMRDYKQNTPDMPAASGLCNAIPGASNRTAAQIINDVSKACHISPQVLLVLLQKEQSLVTDSWPLNSQYRNATGFACPDTAPCNPAFNGFFYQVYHAARQFQVYKAKPNSYNYVAGRVNNIYYNPDLSRCGSSPIYIQNQATAALYIYTPYQPNTAALNNLYGTGDNCSAYGNRNFWRLFNDWFGPTTGPDFGWEETSRTFYTSVRKTATLEGTNLPSDTYVYVEYKIKNVGRKAWNNSDRAVIAIKDDRVSALCDKTSWIYGTCNRIASFRETSVQPGETGTFGFFIKTPKLPGTYTDRYNLVIEGKTWFQDIGAHYSYRVTQSSAPTKLSSASNNVLRPGDTIHSPNGNYSLTLNTAGTLNAYHKGALSWSKYAGITRLDLQEDGNLVAYSRTGSVVWVVSSPYPTNEFRLGNDGVLTYGQFNANGDIVNTVWSEAITAARVDNDKLAPNDVLLPGSSIESQNKMYRLVMQRDGNLVKYRGNTPLAQSGTTNKGHFLIQQTDGNLVIYDRDGRPVWSSARQGANTTTYMQNDRNTVSYSSNKAIWSWW